MPHNRKGGTPVARQNFSMHLDLVKAIMSAANHMNQERTDLIVRDRHKRVTYSKVVAALAWLLKTHYLTDEGEPTQALRDLLALYESTPYEQPDEDAPPDGVEVTELDSSSGTETRRAAEVKDD